MSELERKLQLWAVTYVGIGLYVTLDNIPKIINKDFSNLRFYDKLHLFEQFNQAWGHYHEQEETKKENGLPHDKHDLYEPIQDIIETLRKEMLHEFYYGDLVCKSLNTSV